MTPVRGAWNSRLYAVWLFFLSACATNALAQQLPDPEPLSEEEQLLIGALDDIREERLDSALETLETLLLEHPNFRLAQMVYADTLLAKVSPITPFVVPAENQRHSGVVNALKDEAMRRFNHHRDIPPADKIPEQLLALPRGIREVVVVDLSTSRFYLFENSADGPHLVNDYYVSTGKRVGKKLREGDQKTPVGVYFVTGGIPSSELPDFYGAGALPVNYPNEWDLRNGRTGYGIWIHGVPSSTYARSPHASDGCMALANEDLAAIWNNLAVGGAPVIVTDGTTWTSRDQISQRGHEISDQVEAWEEAWESLELSRYIDFYSKDFHTENKSYQDWVRHKGRVNASKHFIEIDLSELSILGYPGEDNLVVVTFTQDYRSSNFSSKSDKRQYWKRESDGAWRIVYEGGVKIRPEHVRGVPYSARSKLTSVSP